MITYYGVEMPEEVDDSTHLLEITAIISNITTFDFDQQLLLFSDSEDAILAKEYLLTYDYDIEEYVLYHAEKIIPTTIFTDYGFISEKGKYYIYKDMVSPFTVKSGKPQQIEMALIEINEFVVAIEDGQKIIYFVDKQHIELICGIAKAYDIEVSFFHLDK
ncbi:hypothetical protein V1503_16015 [Bacillus sp. SCS-151]|uniref:hypothetical protein n=1 Tax=Nanhaiella sioensis TaxID=3115293 RepID=UPI00397D2BBF